VALTSATSSIADFFTSGADFFASGAAPTRFWWIAPSVTLAAVVVALWAAMRNDTRHREALQVSWKQKRFDNVREVLADALRDLARYERGVTSAAAAVSRRGPWRVARNLAERQPENRDGYLADLEAWRSQNEREFATYLEAARDATLQAERLELLLGPDHSLVTVMNRIDEIGIAIRAEEAFSAPPSRGDQDADLELMLGVADQATRLRHLRSDFRKQAQWYVAHEMGETSSPPPSTEATTDGPIQNLRSHR
jgi:heme exporter protein D